MWYEMQIGNKLDTFKYDFDLSMIHAAGHINLRMLHYMYIKIATALNSQQKEVNVSRILFLGVANKPDIDDERESPALENMDITAHKDGVVENHDPYIPAIKTHKGLLYTTVDLTPEKLNEVGCVILITNQNVFEVDVILQNAKLIVDLRKYGVRRKRKGYLTCDLFNSKTKKDII